MAFQRHLYCQGWQFCTLIKKEKERQLSFFLFSEIAIIIQFLKKKPETIGEENFSQ